MAEGGETDAVVSGAGVAKHTPGPWYVSSSNFNHIIVSEADGTTVGWTTNYPPPENARGEANAHLIAAAPDLLEALEALADDHEFGATGTIRQDHLRAARLAIAKARGQSHAPNDRERQP